ncbi:hypothetical protein F5H01DRAFT_349476 [Linnemannia elongata]|nr:hypothetical protein F5H01DRAFT_349476 [Linnemannia elongata]
MIMLKGMGGLVNKAGQQLLSTAASSANILPFYFLYFFYSFPAHSLFLNRTSILALSLALPSYSFSFFTAITECTFVYTTRSR